MIFPVYKSQKLIVKKPQLFSRGVSKIPTDPAKMSYKNKMDRIRDQMIGFFLHDDIKTGQSKLEKLMERLMVEEPKALIPVVNKLLPIAFESVDDKPKGLAPIIVPQTPVQVNITQAPVEQQENKVIESFPVMESKNFITGETPKLHVENASDNMLDSLLGVKEEDS